MKSAELPTVTVILPIHNGLSDTFETLTSLRLLHYPGHLIDILVVDNASTDNSGKVIRSTFSNISIITLTRNEGFAKAVNHGIKRSKGNYIWVINNDIHFDPKFLLLQITLMESRPRLGITGGIINCQNSKGKELFTGLTLNPWIGSFHRVTRKLTPYTSGWIQGCAMLIKREVTDTIGYFDPGYFYTFEDLDFAKRATQAGFEIAIHPKAFAWHKEGTTINRMGLDIKEYELYYSKFRYFLLRESFPHILSMFLFQLFLVAPVRMTLKKQPYFRLQPFLKALGSIVVQLPQLYKARLKTRLPAKKYLKIGMITSVFNSHSGARAPLTLAKHLALKNHSVTLIGYHDLFDPNVARDLEKSFIKTKIVSRFSPLTCIQTATFIKNSHFDLISFHGTFPQFLGAVLTRLPLVRTYYGTQFDAFTDKYPRFKSSFINSGINTCLRLCEIYMGAFSQATVAISQYTKAQFQKLTGITCDFSYLGSDFTPVPLPKNVNVTLLSVSRIVPYKNFELLIRAVNTLTGQGLNVTLIIAGSSPNKSYVDHLRLLANNNIRIKTDISDEKLHRLYATSHLYVTADRFLFFGLPVVEAAKMGLPTVALNYAAAREVIRHGFSGYVAGNEKQFLLYLKKLVHSESLRQILGKNARVFAQRFSWQTTAHAYQSLFLQLVNRKKPRSLPILPIIFIGLLTRLWFLFTNPFWYDEAVTLAVSHTTLWRLFSLALSETSPPLYYILLHAWSLVSVNIYWLRSLSLVLGITTVYVSFKLANKISSSDTAFMGTVFLILSPLHVYFSTQIRMYSLLTLLAVLLVYFLIEYIKKPESKIQYIFFAIGTIITLTHYYGIFLYLPLLMLPLLNRELTHSVRLKKYIVGAVLSVTPVLLWIVVSSVVVQRGCWCFPSIVGLPMFFTSLAINGVGLTTVRDMWLFLSPLQLLFLISFAAIVNGLLVLGIKKNLETGKRLLLFITGVPLLFAVSASFLLPIFSPRALILLTPFFYLLIAGGINNFPGVKRHTIVLIVSLMLTLVTIFEAIHPLFTQAPPQKENLVYDKKTLSPYEKLILH